MENEEAKPSVTVINNSSSVEAIVLNFRANILSIIDYFQNFGELAQSADKDFSDKTLGIAKNIFNSIGIDLEADVEPDDKRLLEIETESPEKVYEALAVLEELAKKMRKPVKNFEIFSRSSFLMLNNYFEYLLSDLLSYYYNKYQTSLNDKKFDFTLKEINEYETISEAVKAFVTKEVESMMVELSFEKLLDHFESKLKISNEKSFINWEDIIEFRERRHLIVHNSSVVNKKYIVRTKNPYKFKLGDVVHVDRDYFAKACNEFYLAGLLLSYNCWGKWDSKEIDECIEDIMKESFRLLQKEEYELTHKLTSYARIIEARNEDQEDCLARVNFNRLIAIKKIDKKSVLVKELKEVKVGTATPIFKLAHAILSDKHDDVLILIKQAKALEEIDLDIYESWPIFKFLHVLPELNEAIKKELEVEPITKYLPEAEGEPLPDVLVDSNEKVAEVQDASEVDKVD